MRREGTKGRAEITSDKDVDSRMDVERQVQRWVSRGLRMREHAKGKGTVSSDEKEGYSDPREFLADGRFTLEPSLRRKEALVCCR